jgi:hypothetical protein
MPGVEMVDIKIASSYRDSAQVSFEPLGKGFDLEPDRVLYLRLPEDAVAGLEIVIWEVGISVWLNPYPGDYKVLDSDKNEIDWV